ncbi:MAG: 5-formyltetrahydrofolate cyclo-ligase [Actinomycetaceae bacterium]|nr:5-formyltetrahydrofolate cyclo-ligase [Actinomycetaceae bacterium]
MPAAFSHREFPRSLAGGASKSQWRKWLRQQATARYASQGQAYIGESAIFAVLKRVEDFPSSASVVVYQALPRELSLAPLLPHLFARQLQVWVPVVCKTAPGVSFSSLPTGFRLLEEPHTGVSSQREDADRVGSCEVPPPGVGLEQIAARLVLVPALGVDASGVRLGQGGGWYDRELSYLPAQVPVVGCVPSSQFLPSGFLPRAGHDHPVNAVATESGFSPLSGW